jgi:hypothetical protein
VRRLGSRTSLAIAVGLLLALAGPGYAQDTVNDGTSGEIDDGPVGGDDDTQQDDLDEGPVGTVDEEPAGGDDGGEIDDGPVDPP